jgi:hypothetical protein
MVRPIMGKSGAAGPFTLETISQRVFNFHFAVFKKRRELLCASWPVREKLLDSGLK